MAGRPRSGRAYAWRTSKGRSRMLEVDGRFFVLLMSNGILIGLMYSLIALGFVLVYKATDAINFAQGEFVMIAGFVVAVCLVAYGAPLWLAVSAGLLGMVGFGFGLERVMLRRLIGRPIIAVVMATIGLAAILRGVVALTWAMTGVVSALGGVIWGSMLGVDVHLSLVGFKVFPVVILGGLDSIPGAILGGLIVGVVENVAAGYVDPYVGGGTKDFAPYVLMILALMIRPYGIFGKKIIERV